MRAFLSMIYVLNSSKLAMSFALTLFAGITPMATAQEAIPAEIETRQQLTTSIKDELIHQLEKDYVRLLKTAQDPTSLLAAEALLKATNDTSRWTNYSKATKIIRKNPERAAIPLLLWYIVEHSERSYCHVMIPEYAGTIIAISGYTVNLPTQTGKWYRQEVRSNVSEAVDHWWREESKKSTPKIFAASEKRLRVEVHNCLAGITKRGRFDDDDDKPPTCYSVSNSLNKMRTSPSNDRLKFPKLNARMAEIILSLHGYGFEPRESVGRFPYESVLFLAELARNGHRDLISEAGKDPRQNATVRMLCNFALFRAGEEFRSDYFIELIKTETDLERKLISIIALENANEKTVVPLLLELMDDPNSEVAVSAAYAVGVYLPDEALPKLEKLLKRKTAVSKLQVLTVIASYQTFASRKLLEETLEQELAKKGNTSNLSRILRAFVDGTGVPGSRWSSKSDNVRSAAKLALEQYRQKSAQNDEQLAALSKSFSSLKQQLKVVKEIEVLRLKEFKRLLALRGDGAATALDTQSAENKLKAVKAEVAEFQRQLPPLKAKLFGLESQKR